MYQTNLLLIEDCVELKEILHWDIENNFPNLNIKSCSSFKEASLHLQGSRAQIIISDFYLAGSTALELYAIYKDSTRFILMSGDGYIKNKLKSLDIPFLEKPFNSSLLTKFIQNELDKITPKQLNL